MKTKILLIIGCIALFGCGESYEERENRRYHEATKIQDSVLQMLTNVIPKYQKTIIDLNKKHIEDSLQQINTDKYYNIIWNENERRKDVIDSLFDFIKEHSVIKK